MATTPVVTWTLIALNAAVYVVELVYPRVVTLGAMSTAHVATGDWYRMLSSAFLHELPYGGGFGVFGLLHILFNMYALYIVGPVLERLLGHARFIALYVVSALGGSVLYFLLIPPNGPAAIGASGAIFGLFGAAFVLFRRLRMDIRVIVTLIVINLVISFGVASIAWQAHVGGLIAGGALAAAYAYAPQKNRTLTQAAATVGLLALLIGGVVLRDQQLVHAVIVRF